jgi:anti-sigma factor RsiW
VCAADSRAVPLTCREVVELVTEYLENGLPTGERRRFQAHLERCGGCRTYLHQMRATVELLRLAGRAT